MTRQSPVTTVPSPIEVRQAGNGEMTNGALLSVLLICGVYGLIGWLVFSPRWKTVAPAATQRLITHAPPAPAAARPVAALPPIHVTCSAASGTYVCSYSNGARAQVTIQGEERHPCNGCAP